MEEVFARTVAAICGLFFIATGIIGFGQPGRFARTLGLDAASRSGVIEIRAQYGGFFLAAGAICAASASGGAPLNSALLLSTAIFGGLIGGRIAAWLLGRQTDPILPTIRALFLVDAMGFAVSAGALLLVGGAS